MNQPKKPQLTAIQGGRKQEKPQRSAGEVLGIAAAIGVAGVASAGVASVVFNGDRPPSPEAKLSESIKKSTSKINKLHVDGKVYTVTVPPGGTAYDVLSQNEPQAYNSSQGMHTALERDIEGQAANGASSLQANQTVEVPDLPPAGSADPSLNK